MSQICDVCGKTPQFGKSISHSHRRSSRRWSPNIQSVRASVKGTAKRLKVCTSCIKAGKVNRAVKDTPALRAERVQKAKESRVTTSAPASKDPSKQAPTAV